MAGHRAGGVPFICGADGHFCPAAAERGDRGAVEPVRDSTERGRGAGAREKHREAQTDALLWRLWLIESAEREVIFSTFDLRADGSGQDVMAALYGAAQRGVQVRMIIDGLNGFLHLQNSGVLRALAAEENVEVRFYDPIDLLRPWKLNYRLHDKYLIADGSKYILGGRNSNDLFLGSYQENQNIDRDVLVVSDGGEGSSVTQLLTYFDCVWSQPENQTITGQDVLADRRAAGALRGALRGAWKRACRRRLGGGDYGSHAREPAQRFTACGGESARAVGRACPPDGAGR